MKFLRAALCLAFFVLPSYFFAQHPKIDSLFKVLESTKSKEQKADLYNEIAFEYIYIKFDSIKPNAEKAIELSNKIDYPVGVAGAQKNLAVYYFFLGDRKKSFENIYSSIRIFKREKDSVGIASAYNNLATLYKNFGSSKDALKAYDTAIFYNTRIKSNSGLINNNLNIAGIFSKQGNYEKALSVYAIADSINKIEKDLTSSASIKSGIGLVYEEQGKLDSAIILLDESLKVFEKLDRSRNVVAMANNIANVARKKGDYLVSIEYFDRALKSARAISNPRLEAIILNNLANNYLELNDDNKALELYEESAEIIKGIDDYAYAAAISNIALILEKTDPEEAFQYYKTAYDYFEKMGNNPKLISNLNNQANYYYSIGRLKRSKETYLKAKQILKSTDTDYLKTSTWLGLSKTNLYLGQIDSALIYGNEASKLARDTKALSKESEAADLLYQIYKAKNDTKSALKYLEQHEMLKDSLFDKDKTKALGKLEAELDFKNLKNKLELERENEKVENKLKLDTRRKLIIALIAVIVTLSIIVVLLFILKKLKSDSNKKLQNFSDELHHKNEKLKRLHIQKNSLISIISHDFRGPLNNLSQFLDLYIKREISKDEFDEWLPNIKHSIESTQSLVGNLLNWAKQSLNEFNIRKEEVNLYESTSSLIDSQKVSIENKKITVNNRVPENTKIFIDKNTLDLVMRNLLINSIKYCRPNDAILITYKEEDNYSKVCIEDTGVGMDKETASKLFNSGDLISAIGTGKEKGSGIGAVLAKNFLEENDGSIWVDYTEKDKGTRICFKVPLKT